MGVFFFQKQNKTKKIVVKKLKNQEKCFQENNFDFPSSKNMFEIYVKNDFIMYKFNVKCE